jgi:glycosyltransferase involved in cell wall biosynthesis
MLSLSPYPGDPRPRRAAEALVREGMSVDFIGLYDGEDSRREVLNGVNILRLPIEHRRGGTLTYAYEYSSFILLTAAILAWRSLHRRYDLIYVNNMPDILVASALFPKALGAKVILDLHDPMPELMTTIFGLEPERSSVRFIKALEKWSLSRADLVLTVNLACKRIFARRSCLPDKIGVIMNTPDGDIFRFRAARSYPARTACKNGRFVIMYHGSIVERNGLDLVVDALDKVKASVPGAELRVYGPRTPFFDRVLNTVREKRLEDSLRYLGNKRVEDLVPEIEQCDVGVVPNHRNAFTDINTPTRLFEYLALGKPVVAPSTPGITDYFAEDSLFFFESGNAEDLARQIGYVFANPSTATDIAERGQQVYLSHTWEQEEQTLVNLVRELFKGGCTRVSTSTTHSTETIRPGNAQGKEERAIRRSTEQVQRWVEAQNYRGYEPFDGLSSWARPLAFGTQLGERILQQIIRQSPVNLRPLFGIPRQDSTKGQGYMAWGYLTLYKACQDPLLLEKAIRCLEWLDKHKVGRFQYHSWSNHFDFVSRGGSYTKDDPIIVWTSLIGQAYLEAFEITGREWFLNIAESACQWILQLPREKTNRGDCLSYLAHRQSSIHNSNMLGACLLARTGQHNGNQEYFDVARSAIVYSCSRQMADGAWWYGEEPMYRWVDNFHTGYNLDSLHYYMESTGDREFRTNFDRGLVYYKANFFEPTARPKYYTNKTFPVDIQCIAQSIDSLALFSEDDPDSLPLAKKVAAWAIANMQDPQGYFYFRQYPLVKAKTPMLHWGQATMFRALAHLLLRMKISEPAVPCDAEQPARALKSDLTA